MTSAIEYQIYFFSKHLISFGTGLLLALEEDSKLRKNVNQLLLCTMVHFFSKHPVSLAGLEEDPELRQNVNNLFLFHH